MPHDVLISHSTDDKLVALALCNKLESAGVRCWIAPRDVGPGAEWGKAIVDAISSCRLMVLVFSSKANESRHIRREVQTAFEKDLIVIPFRVENTQPTGTMEYYLGSVHWLDALTPPVENHLMGVVERVKALLPAAAQEPAAPIPEIKPSDSRDKKIAAEDDERFETPNRKEDRNSNGSKSESSFDRSGFSDVEWETLLFTPMWVYSAVVWVDGAPKAYEKEALNRELARAESYEVPLFRQFLEVSRAEWNDLMPRWNADSRNTPDGLRDARRILDAKLSADDARSFKECLYQFGCAIAESGGERGQGGGVLQMPKVSFDEQDTLIDIGIMLGLQEGLRPTSPWLASMIAALDERAVPPADKVPAVQKPAAPRPPPILSKPTQTSPESQRPETQSAEVSPSTPKEIPLTEAVPPLIPAVPVANGPRVQAKKVMPFAGAVLLVLVISTLVLAEGKDLSVFTGSLLIVLLAVAIGWALSYLLPKRKLRPASSPLKNEAAPSSAAKKGGNTKLLIISGSLSAVVLLAIVGYFVFRPKSHVRTFSNYVSPSTSRPFPSSDSSSGVFRFSDNESVAYKGTATQADARKVAESLKKQGWFNGSRDTVSLYKNGSNTTISFFWFPRLDDSTVAMFRLIGQGLIADTATSHPLTIELYDRNSKLLKEINIK